MPVPMLLFAAWLPLSFVVALLIGRAINLADQRSELGSWLRPSRRDERVVPGGAYALR